MHFTDLIEKKKNGKELSKQEIEYFVDCVTFDRAPDYQISALLMAILLKGLNERETFDLTDAMTRSGEIMHRGNIEGTVIDKHSTGGVSDSTTLIVVPICLSLGYKFAKLSGRGLGFTGGTLDKLESFAGFDVNLSAEEFERAVAEVGGAIAGQTKDSVPADKKLYALRDVTATVDSIPLIASSIMSKKLASFADILVLDVKYGGGAFMKTAEKAEELARLMVKIGNNAGRKVRAVISSMEQPLGCGVGCNLEIADVISALNGKSSLLLTLSKELTKQFLICDGTPEIQAEELIEESLNTRAALNKLASIIKFQHGSTEYVFHPENIPFGKYKYQLKASRSGYVQKFDTELIGNASVRLGGGREKKEDVIDHMCGINLPIKIGDKVSKDDVIMTLYANDENKLKEVAEFIGNSVTIGMEKIDSLPLIYKIIG